MQLDTGDVLLDVVVSGKGPLVIALHGFPDTRETFREQVPALVAAGYRVARPALRGYAPSGLSRTGRYDLDSLADDVIALADALSPGAPVRLLGHDWGALAAQAASLRAPTRFSHLATIAVPPIRIERFARPAQLGRSWYIAFFQLPLAERALVAREGALVDYLWRRWSPGFCAPADLLAAARAAVAAAPSAALAYYRALPRSLRRLPRRAAPIPQLHLHGQDDGCIGVALARGMVGAEVRVLAGGHFVHLEAPGAVNAALEQFFASRRDDRARQ